MHVLLFTCFNFCRLRKHENPTRKHMTSYNYPYSCCCSTCLFLPEFFSSLPREPSPCFCFLRYDIYYDILYKVNVVRCCMLYRNTLTGNRNGTIKFVPKSVHQELILPIVILIKKLVFTYLANYMSFQSCQSRDLIRDIPVLIFLVFWRFFNPLNNRGWSDI